MQHRPSRARWWHPVPSTMYTSLVCGRRMKSRWFARKRSSFVAHTRRPAASPQESPTGARKVRPVGRHSQLHPAPTTNDRRPRSVCGDFGADDRAEPSLPPWQKPDASEPPPNPASRTGSTSALLRPSSTSARWPGWTYTSIAARANLCVDRFVWRSISSPRQSANRHLARSAARARWLSWNRLWPDRGRAFVNAVNRVGLHGNPIKQSQLIVSAANRVASAATMPLIRHLTKPCCLVRTPLRRARC